MNFPTKVLSKAEVRRAWKLAYPKQALLKSDHSSKIREHISSSPEFKNSRWVTLFHALPWEVEISALWEKRREACLFPRVEGKSLGFYFLSSLKELSKGYSGILEPSGSVGIRSFGSMDLILVPGLAFDQFGGRAGSGKGFYDHFLEGCPAIRWGVCIDAQFQKEAIAQEATDARMDAIVTEKGIFRVKP